jgi:hypothetical protein
VRASAGSWPIPAATPWTTPLKVITSASRSPTCPRRLTGTAQGDARIQPGVRSRLPGDTPPADAARGRSWCCTTRDRDCRQHGLPLRQRRDGPPSSRLCYGSHVAPRVPPAHGAAPLPGPGPAALRGCGHAPDLLPVAAADRWVAPTVSGTPAPQGKPGIARQWFPALQGDPRRAHRACRAGNRMAGTATGPRAHPFWHYRRPAGESGQIAGARIGVLLAGTASNQRHHDAPGRFRAAAQPAPAHRRRQEKHDGRPVPPQGVSPARDSASGAPAAASRKA